jgi:hypothetical protein
MDISNLLAITLRKKLKIKGTPKKNIKIGSIEDQINLKELLTYKDNYS